MPWEEHRGQCSGVGKGRWRRRGWRLGSPIGMREMERLVCQSQRKRNLKNGCHVRCPREVKYCCITEVQIGLGGDGSGGFRCDVSRAECEWVFAGQERKEWGRGSSSPSQRWE